MTWFPGSVCCSCWPSRAWPWCPGPSSAASVRGVSNWTTSHPMGSQQRRCTDHSWEYWVAPFYLGPAPSWCVFIRTVGALINLCLFTGVFDILEPLEGEDFFTLKKKGQTGLNTDDVALVSLCLHICAYWMWKEVRICNRVFELLFKAMLLNFYLQQGLWERLLQQSTHLSGGWLAKIVFIFKLSLLL